jgi:DNA-binding transcriptional MocR family regulator
MMRWRKKSVYLVLDSLPTHEKPNVRDCAASTNRSKARGVAGLRNWSLLSGTMIRIDRESSLSLTEQIVQQLTALAKQGQLAVNARLPSIRQLAGELGVSPYTVVEAYDRLAAAGLIASHASSGYFVTGPVAQPLAFTLDRIGAQGELDAVWLARSALEADAGWINAGGDLLPEHWLEDGVCGSLIQKVSRDRCGEWRKPVPAEGSLPLREALSAYLGFKKIPAGPRCILTTDGATQAIDLICRVCLQADDDIVVVEDPTSPMLLSRLREQSVRIEAVPRGSDGLDLAALEALCKIRRPKVVFTQSVLHNPTGRSSSTSNLHRLLTLAERYDFMIAEDDVCGDLAEGTPVRLAQLSELRHVLYYSSFTKVIGPVVRLGFIAAEPRLLDALTKAKAHAVTSCSGLNERLVLELLRSGRYCKHVKRLRQHIATARGSTTRALAAIGIRSDPLGQGMFLWGKVPGPVDLDVLARDAYDNRILLAPEPVFRSARKPSQSSYIRFNVATSNHAKLADYLRRRLAVTSANADHPRALPQCASRLSDMSLPGWH